MFTDYINVGKRLTIFGSNGMHWGVRFWSEKYGYICFRLPFKSMGRWWPLYLYCSPNGTPWAATFMLGRKKDKNDWALSRIRRSVFGHNFNVHGWNPEYECSNLDILRAINDSVSIYKYNYVQYFREHLERIED